MEDFIKRMLTEQEELTGKMKKLEKAIDENPFRISDNEIEIMKEQLAGMKTYSAALAKRIDLHTEK